jgi:outer membrane protein assembly factor BamB
MVILSLFAISAAGADWPQYRGPNHDGTTPEAIATKWPEGGPKVVWKATLGDSFGSWAVAGGKAFAFIERKGDEVCVAFNDADGKELWATPIDKTTFDKSGGPGPRSTPTVDGDRVYLLGTYLKLFCLNAADGKVVWQHDCPKEFGATQAQAPGIGNWGSAASPVLDGNLIFAHCGGKGSALMAFNKKDGSVAWKTGDDLLTHSTPVPATILGVRQIVFLTQTGLVSCATEDGKILWRQAFPFKVSTASTPIVSGDIVYASAGYGVGSGAYRISKADAGFASKELWFSKTLFNHWTTPVCKDGYLYGIYGFKQYAASGKGAPLKCIEVATGKEMWSQDNFGSGGGTIIANDHVLVQADNGPLVLVEANSKAYTEKARCQPIQGGKFWTMPVVANGRIYARNQKEGICLDAAAK